MQANDKRITESYEIKETLINFLKWETDKSAKTDSGAGWTNGFRRHGNDDLAAKVFYFWSSAGSISVCVVLWQSPLYMRWQLAYSRGTLTLIQTITLRRSPLGHFLLVAIILDIYNIANHVNLEAGLGIGLVSFWPPAKRLRGIIVVMSVCLSVRR